MSSRVYIGNLPSRASERDVEDFFRGFGKIRDVILKSGFGFIEFDDSRDAADAVEELNGRDMCGERVKIELSRRNGREDRYGSRRDDRGGRQNKREKYGPPLQTRYRLLVDNLSTRCSWQDLKDLMRSVGSEPSYADAHKKEPNHAVVCFNSASDLKRAMDKLQGKDINGRRIKLTDDSQAGGDRGGSRSRSPRSRSPRSKSRSRSPRSKSRSASRSRTRSPPPPPSRSRSASPVDEK